MLKGVLGKVFGTRHERERRRIQPIVDEINEHYARLQGVSEEELRGQTAKFRAIIHERTHELEDEVARLKLAKRTTSDPTRARARRQRAERRGWPRRRRGEAARGDRRSARRDPARGVRHGARRRPPTGRHEGDGDRPGARVEHGPLRRAAHGRHRAAPRQDRGDGDGRRQDARRDAAAVPERAAGARRPSRHGELVPRTPRLAVDGAPVQRTSASRSGASTIRSPARRRAARRTSATSRTARTTSSGSTTCATTWWSRSTSACSGSHIFAIVDEVDSVLIDEARTPLIISGPVGNDTDAEYAQHNPGVVAARSAADGPRESARSARASARSKRATPTRPRCCCTRRSWVRRRTSGS